MPKVAAALILFVLIGGLFGLFYSQKRESAAKVSGFIEADEIRVGSRVGGRVDEVLVREGQHVKRGDALVKLQPFDLLAQKARAAAERDAARSEVDRLVAGLRPQEIAQTSARREQLAQKLAELEAGPRKEEVATAAARAKSAKAQLELARHNHQRKKTLAETDRVSEAELDRAIENLRDAEAMVEVRDQELALLRAGTRTEVVRAARAALREADAGLALAREGYRKEDIARARAKLTAAEAELDRIDALLAELVVTAPVDATIEAVDLQPGDLVAPNAPILSLVDLRALWVRAYVPENRMGFALGHEFEVTVDSYPGRRFRGRLVFVSRRAEFTPSNVQTPEERSKQVFRIKVAIEQAPGREAPLWPGIAADIWLGAGK